MRSLGAQLHKPCFKSKMSGTWIESVLLHFCKCIAVLKAYAKTGCFETCKSMILQHLCLVSHTDWKWINLCIFPTNTCQQTHSYETTCIYFPPISVSRHTQQHSYDLPCMAQSVWDCSVAIASLSYVYRYSRSYYAVGVFSRSQVIKNFAVYDIVW